MSTKIEYNGSIVATVEGGNTATLPVKGKEMETDILVTVPEAEDSAVPIEVATEAEMTALLESGEVGGVYKYVGESTDAYENGALYVLEEDALVGTWVFNSEVTTDLSETVLFVSSDTSSSSVFGVLTTTSGVYNLVCDYFYSASNSYIGFRLIPSVNPKFAVAYTDSSSSTALYSRPLTALAGHELVLYDNISELNIADEFRPFMESNATKQ